MFTVKRRSSVLDRHVSTQCVDYETGSCASSHTKIWVSPYEARGTRVRVRLRVRLGVRVRARVIEQKSSRKQLWLG